MNALVDCTEITRDQVFNIATSTLIVNTEVLSRFGLHPIGSNQFLETESLPSDLATDIYSSVTDTKYGKLAPIARTLITEQLDQDDPYQMQHVRMPLDSGLMVISKFISLGVEAYDNYCQEQEHQPAVSELQATFHKSYGTLAKFAATNIRTSEDLETIYGLRGSRGKLLGYTCEEDLGLDFIIHRGESGLRIMPDQWERALLRAVGFSALKDDSYQEVIAAARETVFSQTSRCPAYAGLIPAAYHWAIDMSASAQEFFGDDINRIMEPVNAS